MKLNKTLALAALMAGGLIAANTLQAQDSTNTPPAGEHHGGPGGMHRPNAEMIAKELGLTDDQKTQIKAALEDTMAKFKALHDDTSLSADDKKAKMKEIRDANQAKMKEILTPEQFAKWQKHMQQHRPGGPGGEKGGDAPPKE
jgi:Spy/CpxP family protein refolding chaperone